MMHVAATSKVVREQKQQFESDYWHWGLTVGVHANGRR